MKKILVTGATGFVGRALMLRLARDGHDLTALVRDEARARSVLGDGVAMVRAGDDRALAAAVARADAVVNLAGEPIADRRWSARRKEALRASRVGVTEAIARAAAARPARLPVLVSASAVGLYGDRGDEVLDEHAAPGEGFAADLCAAWERAAAAVPAARSAILRIGVVVGPEGGALAKLAPMLRARVAGRVGDGRQWVSWIDLVDLVELIATAIADDRWRGTFHATAPEPATNADFTRACARIVGGAAPLPAPAALVRLALGERARLLLDSARCVPAAALALGFTFRSPTLDALVGHAAADAAGVSITPAVPAEVPPSTYLAARRPRYVLETTTELAAPLDDVFAFFSDAGNLELLTPPSLGFRIATPRPIAMADGATIDYALSLGPVPFGWRTVIERWEPNRRFVDTQARGPYRAWYHEHHFVARGDRTAMIDRVYYAPPAGPLGRIANRLVVAPMLRRIFGFRRHAIALRFGNS